MTLLRKAHFIRLFRKRKEPLKNQVALFVGESYVIEFSPNPKNRRQIHQVEYLTEPQ